MGSHYDYEETDEERALNEQTTQIWLEHRKSHPNGGCQHLENEIDSLKRKVSDLQKELSTVTGKRT